MKSLAVEELVAAVEKTVRDRTLPWVLFSHGTFVILAPELLLRADLAAAALLCLARYGPVHPGTPSADFSVAALQHVGGWAVSSHGPGLFPMSTPAN
jgi:hypothetical protein